MTADARDSFDGFQAMFNVRANSCRRGKEADKAADEGISPWKIGQLAAALLLWDIMWNVITIAFKEQMLIQQCHIDRAFLLMSIFTEIRVQVQSYGQIANPETLPARQDYSSEDQARVDGMPVLPNGYKFTEFLRKFLSRGKPYGDDESWEAGHIYCCSHAMVVTRRGIRRFPFKP